MAPPQLLLSGVNRGLNLGMETVFSGTVGGAMTGMMLGVPSIALSQAYKDRNNVTGTRRARLGAKVVRDLLAIGWSKDACLNINFPACSAAEAGPMTLARQGVGMVAGMHVDTRVDPRGMAYHWLNFRRGDRQQGPESDYDALRAGNIVVTPSPLRPDRRGRVSGAGGETAAIRPVTSEAAGHIDRQSRHEIRIRRSEEADHLRLIGRFGHPSQRMRSISAA